MAVLYGSQTGNAEEVAEDLHRQIERMARRKEINVDATSVSAMNDFDPATLPLQKFVVFVTSTTGQGDPPDNMKAFWRFLLRRSLPLRTSLALTNFAVFGLGDSSYPKYNVVARKLYRRLEDLGGNPLVGLTSSLGDDQNPNGGYFAALDLWTDQLFHKLREACGGIGNGGHEPTAGAIDVDESKIVVERAERPEARASQFDLSKEIALCHRVLRATLGNQGQASAHAPVDSGDSDGGSKERPFFAQLRGNEMLTAPSHAQDVRAVSFDLHPRMCYSPGDVLGILPSQRGDLVAEFLARIGAREDEWVRLRCRKDGGSSGTSQDVIHLGTLFTHCLDCTSAAPRKYFFQIASFFTGVEDAMEREKLAELGSREGRDDLHQYCTRERRSLLECLQDFPSVSLPLEWVIQLCPKLQPRLFSISSACRDASEAENDRQSDRGAPIGGGVRCELTVAVVRYKTPWKREIEGLCSNYLRDLGVGSSVPVWVESGTLDFDHLLGPQPEESSASLGGEREACAILIGPGTGIAPFKSLVEHLVSAAEGGERARTMKILVFFGCRSRGKDYLHRSFWEECVRGSEIFASPGGFAAAFSRDQRGEVLTRASDGSVESRALGRAPAVDLPSYSTTNKFYVQDAIDACSKEVYDVMHLRRGSVYVAGSTGQMPRDVRAALAKVMVRHHGMGESEADEYIRRMEATKRYQVEAWG